MDCIIFWFYVILLSCTSWKPLSEIVGLCETPVETPPSACQNCTEKRSRGSMTQIALMTQPNASPMSYSHLPCYVTTPVARADHSIVQLSAAASTNRIQVLVALDRTALCRLYRTGATVTKALHAGPGTSWRGRQAAIGTGRAAATVSVLSIIRTSSIGVESLSTTTHRPGIAVVVGAVDIPVAHGRVEHTRHAHAVLHSITRHAHIHVGQVEASRGACCLDVVAHRKVTVAVGIAARRGNMGRIYDV
jgi:hypothetical protein